MESLIDTDATGNTPEFSVSEISGAVKRMIEGEFGHVRVRGELGRVSRPRSGHIYLDVKDDRAVLAGVVWKGVAARLATQPEEGMEVIVTGRLTTFPGQSKYQIVIEDIAPAGIGALMAMLEKRRKALAAEGLFDADRKTRLPFLPQTIGVVTSPSGAVIRDILHRLRDRFPVHVLVWPVAVQGERCAPEVASAIAGFNAMERRPDVLIVARGGGSVEDLWGFNDEAVVRAVSASRIPVISAIGHETDTTLIDHAADLRAPTPTAAAEAAVPVRAELQAMLADLEARRIRALGSQIMMRRQRLADLGRSLPRPEQILGERRQRLDLATARLPGADSLTDAWRRRLERMATGLPRPADLVTPARHALAERSARLVPALNMRVQDARLRLGRQSGRLAPSALQARLSDRRDRLRVQAGLLAPAAQRMRRRAMDRVAALGRTLRAYDYNQTLARGFALVRDGDGRVMARAGDVEMGSALSLTFADGDVAATAVGSSASKPPRRKTKKTQTSSQGSLFE